MLALYALGELRLESAAAQVLSRRRKPLVLLTYLARRAPRPASRVELASLLWGERPEAKARQSLRQALLELHRLVGDALLVTGDSVALAPGAVSLDATRFEEDVEAGRDAVAVARWNGAFCAGAEDAGEMAFRAWADSENAGLERRLRLAFERLIDEADRSGDDHAAVEIARRWTGLVPLDEHACLRLITALRRAGNPAEALAVHASFTARLREELELAPSRAFARLAPALDESARTPAPWSSRIPVPPAADRAPHRLVGRSAAFSSLSDAWRDARGGRPSVVVLRAEQGSGASRLCAKFMRSAADASPMILAFDGERWQPADAADRFSGLVAMLHPLGDAPGLGGLAPGSLSVLGAVVPSIGTRFAGILPAGPPSTSEIADALRDALEAVAEDAPVLLVVDRLDQLDADSRLVLLEALRRSRGSVLALLVACTAESEVRAIERSLAGAPSVSSLLLHTLSTTEVGELLATSTSLAQADAAQLAEALVRETSGVPAYVVAMLDAMLEDGLLTRAGARGPRLPIPDPATLAVPDAIHQILRDRRGALSSDARLMLDVAAVYGRPFDVQVASKIGEIAPIDAASAIERLVQERLLVSSTHGRFAIAPPVVKRAMHERMPVLRREALHAAAAALAESENGWRIGRGNRVATHRPLHDGVRRGTAATRRRLLLAAGLVAALATTALLLRRPDAAPERAPAVAIFPFAVTGDSSLRFLEAGMVDLLSASLDGAAGLRTIDPRAVIATVGAAARAAPLGIDEARRSAETLGARYFVLGTVLGVSGRLEMNVALYATDRAGPPV